MVKIRLTRIGSKKNPKYRVVVQDARTRRDGSVIQQLGFFNPQIEENDLLIDAELTKSWLAKGAQPTDTVRSLLRKAGILEK
jgi:small subunit ribosomal protein S16